VGERSEPKNLSCMRDAGIMGTITRKRNEMERCNIKFLQPYPLERRPEVKELHNCRGMHYSEEFFLITTQGLEVPYG